MNENMVSVVVLTYNTSWENLKRTLLSILGQKKCLFEIIISDDGSSITYFEEIKELFFQNNFEEYQLIFHEKNQGTVLNMYDALQKCRGKYVKDIGQGDMLYSPTTLFEFVTYIEHNEYDVVFGEAVPYKDNENVEYGEKTRFQSEISQIGLKAESFRVASLVYGDYPVGATFVFQKDTFLYYLEKIKDKIIYCEDYAVQLMVLEKLKVMYYPHNIVYYDFDSGISKNGFKRMQKDARTFYNIVRKQGSYTKLSFCNRVFMFIKNKNNEVNSRWGLLLLLISVLIDFRYGSFIVKRRFFPRHLPPVDPSFLQECTGKTVVRSNLICK